ncbi:hypothetical protein POX_d04992 [Penicillium oxalicum]|uniref:hypothetical protein n=1 Tax=Penicillium oxalicum TaxID=69781 RepID=UPI0020B6EE0E|nr:hypothetical protein POX_d04992 [Penicillium oxalicum]KAI2789500.1 hypothetical protein POX_d04992 [Penicillium oxalicum]
MKTCLPVPPVPLRILTHNIRYATSSPFKGEVPWEQRKNLLINELRYHTRHPNDTLVCLQEVLHEQLVDIHTGLNKATSSLESDWAYIGVGRDDGHQAGEYSPIFYRESAWCLIHWETVWLSKTPSTPSKNWDAASIRILTIGVLSHRESGNTILAMNTHLDDQGSRSRLEAARIIRAKIREYRCRECAYLINGAFLAGDLNSQEDQEAYSDLVGSGDFVDTFKMVDPCRRYGNYHTFTGFGYEKEPPSRIDYVLLSTVKPNAEWKAEGYSVMTNKFDDGIYNSDHCAVIADIHLLCR